VNPPPTKRLATKIISLWAIPGCCVGGKSVLIGTRYDFSWDKVVILYYIAKYIFYIFCLELLYYKINVCLQEKFLQERMKYNGKTNNFGNVISLEKTKTKIIVNSDVPFTKR